MRKGSLFKLERNPLFFFFCFSQSENGRTKGGRRRSVLTIEHMEEEKNGRKRRRKKKFEIWIKEKTERKRETNRGERQRVRGTLQRRYY